jgi:hypothetical protein
MFPPKKGSLLPFFADKVKQHANLPFSSLAIMLTPLQAIMKT